jgi:hypothetical protein
LEAEEAPASKKGRGVQHPRRAIVGEPSAKKRTARSAEELLAEAASARDAAKAALEKADGSRRDAEGQAATAKKQTKQADDTTEKAQDAIRAAKQSIKDAEAQIEDAKALHEKAVQDGEDAEKQLKTAVKAQGAADKTMQTAKDEEESALSASAHGRVCVDLPGVRLHNWGPEDEYRRIVDPDNYPEMDGIEACSEWCKAHDACAQAVFSYVGVSENSSACHMYPERGDLYDFRDDFNASWCGSVDEVKYLVKEVKKVFDQKPWVGENYGAVPCGFGGDDCRETKCCGSQQCDWKFEDCTYFSCVVQDENFAGCQETPQDAESVTILGGGPPEDDIEPAEEGKLVHPSSLFCFVVMMPGAHGSAGVSMDEGILVDVARKTNSSIFSCDDQLVIEGYDGGGGSESNIDEFIGYWKQVKEDGRYMLHDWLIKADADCVFVADRVRAHIENFRPPAGAAVYFRNTDYKFHFMGAFEMMSREGAIVFFANSWQCDEKIGHTGGEDYWMRLCLDTLGLRHITDYSLMNDKYAAHDGCGDSWAASFHFYKTEEQYMFCLNEIWNNR